MSKPISCTLGFFFILILMGFSPTVSALENNTSEPIGYTLLPTGAIASQPVLYSITTVPTPTISSSIAESVEIAITPEGATPEPSLAIPILHPAAQGSAGAPVPTPYGMLPPEPAQPEETSSSAPSVILAGTAACPDCPGNSTPSLQSASPNTSFTYGTASEELGEIQRAIKDKGKNWTAKENEISALSDEELRMMLGVLPASGSPKSQQTSGGVRITYDPVSLPASLDWRNNGGDYTTPVRDQDGCGSCWAFATIAAFESRMEIANNNPNLNPDYSEQDLVSCAGCGGCSGAALYCPQNWLLYHGAVSESCFPYVAWDAPCKSDCTPHHKILGWRYVSPNTEQEIKEALTRGPLSASFSVYEDYVYYDSGVYEHVVGRFLGYHAMAIVGWGTDSVGTYWICKNSWGANWGESGYIRIRSGNCGINDELYELTVLLTYVDAAMVSNTIPSTMTPGQSYDVVVRLQNTGTMPWSETNTIRLGAVGDAGGHAALFGPGRIKIPAGTTVAPGQTYDFSYTMTAPSTAGTYTPQYQMVWDGHEWFGQVLSRTVTVTGSLYVDAAAVSSTIPSTMTPGQSYDVVVRMQNTGTMPWSETSTIRLGAVGDAGGHAYLFGPGRITLPAGTTVAPGQTYDFSFTMTAPGTAGTYTPQYQTVWDGHQWFGQVLSRTVTVTGSLYVDAAAVSSTIPSSMTPGQSYDVVVRMQNTGTMPWSETNTIRLGAVGDAGGHAALFGPGRIKIPAGTTVAPGQTYDFSFTMTAPGTGGTYTPQYQMVWDGHQWFGQTMSRTVTVTGSLYVDAAAVSSTIPSSMTPGQSYDVVVRMQNTGTMPWSETSTIRLGAVGDAGGHAYLFGPGRITLPAGTTVAPGQTYDFSFTMTAPGTGGTYMPQYQMVWDGHQWFGQTMSRTVTVTGSLYVDAAVVSSTIPSTMTPGQSYDVVVRMQNTGTMPWSETNTIRLGAVGDAGGHAYLFGPGRIKIPAGTTVAPAQTYDFGFTMTAPGTGGTYTPQYQMVWDGHQWFGQVLSRTVTL